MSMVGVMKMKGIKTAQDIVEDMKARGQINVPDGCVTEEEFEEWLCKNGDDYACSDYNKETGICKSTGKYCDACYNHYINTPLD